MIFPIYICTYNYLQKQVQDKSYGTISMSKNTIEVMYNEINLYYKTLING